MASHGTDTALGAAEVVTARTPLQSPALGTMAALQGVPAPQTTDNALLSTDAHLLETQHDTLTIPEDRSTVVRLGDAEIEKPQLPSDTEWPPSDRKSISYFKLYRYCDGWDYLLIVLGFIGAATSGAALPVFTLVFGRIINVLGKGDSPAGLTSEVNDVTKYFCYLGVVSFVSSFFQMSMWTITGLRQTNRIRALYLQRALQQEVGFFDVHATTGMMMQGLNEDTLIIQQAIGEKVGVTIHFMATFIAGYAIAFARGWDLTLVLLAVMPLLAGAAFGIATFMGKKEANASAAYALANGIVQEALSGIRTVISFNGEKRTAERYKRCLVEPEKVGARSSLLSGFLVGSVQIGFLGSYALALWYGGTRIRAGAYDGGKVMNVLFAAIIGGFSLGQAAPNFQFFTKGKPGQTLALVGESGSGKSTTIQLIQRFYDPLQGQVLLDGMNVRDVPLDWLRSHMGLVSQEPVLFACSLKDNIMYGRPGSSQEELEAAAKAAFAHDFIASFPDGYNTMVGEKGSAMSGGQKQRVAIARAILRNPRLLLLDEATAALDARSERAVQAALDGLMVNRTTIVVAHRLSTILNADVISVVGKGKIVEQGNHADLVSRPGGAYAALVRLQQRDPALETNPAKEAIEAGDYALTAHSSKQLISQKQLAIDIADPKQEAQAAPKWQIWKRFKKQPPTVEVAPELQVNASFGRLLSYNKPELGWAVLGIAASAGSGVVMPIFALALSSVVSLFFNPDKAYQAHQIAIWSGIFACIGFGAFVSAVLQQWSFGLMGQRLTSRIRHMLLYSALRQEVGWFDREENSSGAIAGRLATDAAHIRGAVADFAGMICQNICTFIAAYAIAFSYNWKMTLVVTAMVPLIAFGFFVQNKLMMGYGQKVNQLYDQANQVASESFSSIRVVAAFTLEKHIMHLYRSLLAGPTRVSRKSAWTSGFGFGFGQASIFFVYALVFWYGGQLISQGELTFESMLKVFFAILLGAVGLTQAQMAFPDVAKASGASKRVFTVIDRQPLIQDPPDAKQLAEVKGELEIRDVNFSYPQRPKVKVLRGFSLTAHAGQTVALVGASGNGKSTIVGLLERWYDVTSGQILLDGHDIRGLELQWLRSNIGLVGQEPLLFSCSIRDNICYGCPEATEEQVLSAAADSNALTFIQQLPEGLDTQVGEGGLQLSGGQKQRVAIARAIVRNPKLLCLDEATSALDATSEQVVQQALERVMAGRTTLVIAHRLSTIQGADNIAVVQSGRVYEAGTHAQLMRIPNGAYAGLVRHQQQHN
ncbi:hypothetical protein WJX84_002505 [Apatococcus fuscideae]|uniref:Uncharacterized protein n=1 Tax=Apatococcus fuscideae TaxID=2026836 RepID=A0AAW1SY97_9CHLO